MNRIQNNKHEERNVEEHLIPLLSDYGFKISFVEDSPFSRKAVELLAKLDKPVNQLTFLRNEIEAMTVDARSGLYDVVCQDEHLRVFVIEMQVDNYTYFKERIMFYVFQMYCSCVKVGKLGFMDLPPIHCICIVEDKITAGEDYYQKFMLRNEKGEQFSQLIEINLVELGKFPILQHEYDKINTEMEELVYTLKYVHTFSIGDMIQFPKFWEKVWYMDVLKKLDLNRMDPMHKAIYEMSIVRNKIRLDKLAEEFEEVRNEEKDMRIKRALVSTKFSMEDIAELFEVSKDYVIALKKQLEENESKS